MSGRTATPQDAARTPGARPTPVAPMPTAHRAFRAAWWLPGPHAQTLWGMVRRRGAELPSRHERLETPDGDFVDLRRLDGPKGAPRLVIFHGLEGTHRSHYVQGCFAEARRRGWRADLMHFRGCGPEINRLRRFYHSGETTDADWFVRRLVAEDPEAPLLLAGFSLGGNVLLKWLGETGAGVPPQVRGAVAVSVPYDLARGSRHIARGFSRVYERSFLKSLLRKATAKLAVYPDLVPASDRLLRTRSIWEFDDLLTAPVHGFESAEDYYRRSSALGFLHGIRVPTLLLSAVDDPFLPAAVLDEVRRAVAGNRAVAVEFVRKGGHVGFVGGRNPLRPFYYGEWRTAEFLAARLDAPQVPSPLEVERSS